ncbi:sugar transferase [Phytoactinopolyspora halotolerans]|uniref:Sugar transferase n=1 Tax=Phytoactinopolyspora halotolerans TaxID=1981512 RepID=A0A6L9S3F7_9ACTN|nr:sugar transferase [Phytoactinopolyspora halotolerans]NED99586.1 sugar transferase [Phytoactinopolyspora halotolerans]
MAVVSGSIARLVAIGTVWGLGLQLLIDLLVRPGGDPMRYAWFVAASVSILTTTLIVRRVAWRRLRVMRQHGLAVCRTLAVGSGAQINAVMDRFAADTEHPYVVVGACVEGENGLVEDVPQVERLPLAAGSDKQAGDDLVVGRVLAAVEQVGATAVCIAPGSQFTGDRLRALSWALNERGVALVTDLGTNDVSPHRLWLRRAGASTLLHLRPVPFRGPRRALKSAFDRVAAALLVVLLAPVMLTLAAAVKGSSPGPAIYRQTRIGRGGKPFTMLKFRSMHVDADVRREALLDSVQVDGPMFKMYDDPRITRIGRMLRRYSLDELPQLFNVIRGDMSLVGPRPPLPEEVASYSQVESHRLLVTPGMTGLWQVSGRSNLTWEETVRLDLSYVDNWTLGGDMRLLGRTAGAVIRSTGAY